MNSVNRGQLRVLRRLAIAGAKLEFLRGRGYRLSRPGKQDSVVDDQTFAVLRARDLLAPGPTANTIVLTETGRAVVRRFLSEMEDFAAQHQTRETITITDDETGPRQVTVNQDESPLSWLRHRRGRDGRPMIDAVEFSAGERLRADYSRGQLMPRVTANWGAAVADRRRDGGGGIAELTEVALAARQRVERALDAVGPELGGLLVDFCCFLKGLEEIERDRAWPARSAKVVLRLGLASLARHYGLGAEAHGASRSKGVRHWGAEDYRPTID